MSFVAIVRAPNGKISGVKMNLYQKYKNLPKEKRSIVNIILIFSFGICWSVIKLLMGVYQNSNFLIVSALFTMCLALSKLCCLIGIVKHREKYVRITHVLSSLLIVFGGVFYGLYNLRLLNGQTAANYGLIPSITIATVSFTLFIKSVVVLFRDKRRDDYHRNLRILSFISACVDIVLTQMSLLAVQAPEMDPVYNFYIAIGVAIMTVGLGIYCIVAPFTEKNKQSAVAEEDEEIEDLFI